jgi:hypothetical protein
MDPNPDALKLAKKTSGDSDSNQKFQKSFISTAVATGVPYIKEQSSSFCQ